MKQNKSITIKKKKITLGVLAVLGAMSFQTFVYAGPGLVCSDGTLPTAPDTCPAGSLIVPTYYANSPLLRKFVDTLPGLTVNGKNNLGAYLPVAKKDTESYPGSDYYELAVVEYAQRLHSDLQKATTLRGYVQLDRETTNGQPVGVKSTHPLALKYPDGSPIFVAKEKGVVNGVWDHSLVKDNAGQVLMVAAIALDAPRYMGPMISATKGVPTRIKMNNLLPKGRATGSDATQDVVRHGDIFLPVDESISGAGDSVIPSTTFPQNRVAIHLHGGDSPWISDGTPNQWFSAETDSSIDPILKRGDRTFNVPDMPYPGEAAQTLFWLNDQSARFMWYHDHSLGITRQNAYAGMAALYLISDPKEDSALASAVPVDTIPLILQDKTFVPNDIASQDSKWDQAHWGQPGDLWYPHAYEPNILDVDPVSKQLIAPFNNPAGRWDFGPTLLDTPIASVLAVPDGSYGQVSVGPEAFHDSAVVNGAVYPTVTLEPKAYRVRFLNASNDRYFNLSLWVADNTVFSSDGRSETEVKLVPEVLPSTITISDGGTGYVTPQVIITDLGGYGSGAVATATVDSVTGTITGINLDNPGSGYINPQVQISEAGHTGVDAVVSLLTSSGRAEGIPDPTSAGPDIIQFGNEAGLLPKPVVHNPKAMSFNSVGEEVSGGFYLGNAERGDTVIDLSQYAGKTLILYNDSSAPVPAGDPRYDYFTGNPDQRSSGGSDSTLAGFGPNTRTLMQIKVAATLGYGAKTPAAYDENGNGGALANILPSVYAASADALIETGIVADGQQTGLTLSDWQALHPKVVINNVKTIEGGFDVNFGRLIANFGVELPGQNNPTPLAYIDAPTDIVKEGEVQYWQIKNRDEDNHPIHFHLFNVQVLARVDQLTGAVINPTPDEAGWKDTVQNWPFQNIIVALKPKTPALPFGLPDSVRLMDPVLNPGDDTNTSLEQNYMNAGVPASSIPLAFQQYDLVTGDPKAVVNDVKNYGWEYTFHCHILGHEENDLMRPMAFLPIAPALPKAPSAVALNATNGLISWKDATASGGSGTKGNPGNEIGFRVDYAPKINGVVGSFIPAIPMGGIDPFTIIPDTVTLSNNLQSNPTAKINALANAVSFNADLKSLTPNTDFVYRVVAVNQVGETSSTGVTFVQGPAQVTGLTATINSVTGVTLNWIDNATNESGFAVEYSIDNGKTWKLQNTVPASNAGGLVTYLVTGLAKNTLYQFRVGATKSGFPTKPSAPVSVALTIPAAPSGLTAAVTAGVSGVVNLSWKDNAGNETGFTVQRSTNRTFTAGVVTTLIPGVNNSSTDTYKLTGLTKGTIYYFRVKASNPVGNSAWASTATPVTVP